LGRQVELLADGRLGGHDLDQLGRNVVRVRRGETDAPDPGDASDFAQQAGEVPVAISIRVDGLPEERDLRDPAGDDVADLRENSLGFAVLLVAADVGDDAVGAAVVAASLYGDPRADPRVAMDFEPLVVLVGLEIEHGETRSFGVTLAT